MQELQIEVARELMSALRSADAATVELFWSDLAGNVKASVRARDASGAQTNLKMQRGVIKPMGELRSVMADPQKGAWLSVVVRVTSGGDYEFEFNYDRRPYWYSPTFLEPTERDLTEPSPSDETLVADLERFPRTPEFIPEWYPSAADAVAPPGAAPADPRALAIESVALFPESLAALADNRDWVEIAEGLRQQLGAVIVEGSEADDATIVHEAYNRVFDVFLEPRTAAIVKRIWAPANAAAGYPPKSTDIPDDEPVSKPSETLEVLLEDISDVMSTIAEHQLARAG